MSAPVISKKHRRPSILLKPWFLFLSIQSHPVKIPQVNIFFRITQYRGGRHVFSDGTSLLHADYFSGWNETHLQEVLDKCINDGDEPNPDKWCEDFVTFRDAPKYYPLEEADIVAALTKFQPTVNVTKTVTAESIDGIVDLPKGACTGSLIQAEASSGAGLAQPIIIGIAVGCVAAAALAAGITWKVLNSRRAANPPAMKVEVQRMQA